jgi:acetoin utilization deacetylase AcuC-like enzyme
LEELALFYPEGHEAHAMYGHPERPERVEVIKRTLENSGYWDRYIRLEPVAVNQEILEAIHDPVYLERLEQTSKLASSLDLDTYTTEDSWQLARNAAGGAIAVAKSTWRRRSRRGFALTRPPGHHATMSRGMGFCLMNNVAIAAESLLQEEGAIRLAIVDLDLHHGNGTQDIFWTRDDVFYISTHQYPHYPGTGRLQEIGSGRGEGFTANFPIPPMSGDEAFDRIMREAIIPIIHNFMPEMILVSYGFDTHWKDPLGQVLLSASGYGNLISYLTTYADENCDGRIALFLEGGYNLEAAEACTMSVLGSLIGIDVEDPIGPSPMPEMDGWKEMLHHAKRIWGV